MRKANQKPESNVIYLRARQAPVEKVDIDRSLDEATKDLYFAARGAIKLLAACRHQLGLEQMPPI